MTTTAITQTADAHSNPSEVPGMAPECPECCAEVTFDQNPMLHEILPCADCGAELEVVAIDPVAVELAPEVEEDWGE